MAPSDIGPFTRSTPRSRSQRSAAAEELLRHLAVVDRVEEAEVPRAILVGALPVAIDARRDPPDGLPAPQGHEERGLGVLEERVLLRVEALLDLEAERRDPRGVALEHAIGRAQEGREVSTGIDLLDLPASSGAEPSKVYGRLTTRSGAAA
ncbi:MAG: hypothetical protein M5U28_16070 [Sandaracinaceae bacterium]|nr:hypothetical protein [Sandaracinaceae bacterium]